MTIINEIIESVKTGKLDQKYIYMLDGANSYYDNVLYKPNRKFSKFIANNTGNVLISMGCGNSYDEAQIIKKKNCCYLGVDYSEDMLELSRKNLESLNYKLIKDDFNNIELINEISIPMGKRTFLFNGFTINNIDIDYLKKVIDIMLPDDNLIFNASCDDLIKNEEIIKNELLEMNQYLPKMNCYLYPLRLIDMDEDKVEIIFENYGDYFKFEFYITTKKYYPFIKKGKRIILQEMKIFSFDYFKNFARMNNLKMSYLTEFDYYTMICYSKK